MKPKLLSILQHHKKELPREQILKDIIAGFLVACIAFPLSIALGIASGVSPEKGLLTAVIAGLCCSLFGGSRVQIGGPTGAFVVIVFGIIQQFGLSGLTTATFLAGIILLGFGFFKIGNLIKFIPFPITTGFTTGIALVLFFTQLKDFLGLQVNLPIEFLPRLAGYWSHFPELHIPTILLGFSGLCIMIVWPKMNRTIPGALVALIVTTLIAPWFGEIATIQSRFGALNPVFPMPQLPSISLAMVVKVWPAALTIAFLAAIESLLSAVVADGMIGKKHRSNAELVGQGVANIVSALFGGIPATGAIARTAANVTYGGRTPISGIVHSLSIFIIMMLFLPLAAHIPLVTLSAILFIVAYKMSHWRSFIDVFRSTKSDAFVLVTTFILTVAFDLVTAIEAGMVLTAFLFMKRMVDVTEVHDATDELVNELHIQNENEREILQMHIKAYTINGPLFFGAADALLNGIENLQNWTKVLILRLGHVPALDVTGLQALIRIEQKCRKNKVTLLLCRVQPQPLQVLIRSGFQDALGAEAFCNDLDTAYDRARAHIQGHG